MVRPAADQPPAISVWAIFLKVQGLYCRRASPGFGGLECWV